MVHRGPDDQGIYADGTVCIGMRRLSVIDLAGGRQPISNEDDSVWIVFNGEIYNYGKLRSDLIARGHQFKTVSDTEVIVHLYEEYGEACLDHLEGMFALALWDLEAETLLLARDRLGVKPLVYHFDGERLIFASEINAVLAADGSLNELNPEALDDFMTYLYVPAPKTMFQRIWKLPPGHVLTYRKGRTRVKPYWDMDLQGDAPSPSPEACLERARYLLSESIKMRMISEVPLGAFLSGGMDSASLIAFMVECNPGPVKTFTVGYGDEDATYNELADARAVARHFGTEHREFVLSPDVVEILPQIVESIGEPFADSSAIPTYLISRESRKHVTVALTGIGGDETFMGYPRYLGARLSAAYARLPIWIRRNVVAPIAERFPETTGSRNVGGWVKRFARGGLVDPVSRYLQWISFCSPEIKRALYSGTFKEQVANHDATDLHRRYLSQVSHLEYSRGIAYLDFKTYLPGDLLYMADAMSMAHSLELRVPFCDHKLVEFMMRLPAGVKMKGFRLKGLLRQMMKGVLPPQTIAKKKQGFMVPIGAWFQRDLEGYVRETLLSDRFSERGFFNPLFIQEVLETHFQGKRVWSHQIWALLTFELWCQRYLDRAAVAQAEAVVSGAV
jgi:asparagine synthase (glutamine-hydrolysing)